MKLHIHVMTLFASIISVALLVLFIATPYLVSDTKPFEHARYVIAISLDFSLLILGIIAMLLAARGRYSWGMATLIVATPLIQLLSTRFVTFGLVYVLVYIVLNVLILLFAAMQQLKSFVH